MCVACGCEVAENDESAGSDSEAQLRDEAATELSEEKAGALSA